MPSCSSSLILLSLSSTPASSFCSFLSTYARTASLHGFPFLQQKHRDSCYLPEENLFLTYLRTKSKFLIWFLYLTRPPIPWDEIEEFKCFSKERGARVSLRHSGCITLQISRLRLEFPHGGKKTEIQREEPRSGAIFLESFTRTHRVDLRILGNQVKGSRPNKSVLRRGVFRVEHQLVALVHPPLANFVLMLIKRSLA